MSDLFGAKIEVLDHGYVQAVESWGSDERIIEAARMSTQKGFEGWGEEQCSECGGNGTGPDKIDGPGEVYQDKCTRCAGKGRTVGDEKLLRYLWTNNHATPFEMAGLIVEVQAPILVFREWHRHRTQSYNEMSARYAPLPDLNYVPTVERLMLNSKTNKQAGRVDGADVLDEEEAQRFREALGVGYNLAQEVYENALKAGVPKELARCILPVARYSRMRASANLRNWLGFLTLRADSKAQWEIQQFAWAVHGILKEKFPRTLSLFDEGRAK